MSLIKEKLVTISGNKAQLTQVGGLMKNSTFYKSLNDQQLVSLLMIPTTKHDLQSRITKIKGQKKSRTRKFRKRRRGGRKSRSRR